MSKHPKERIQCQIKLRINKKQEALLDQWLWQLTGVYNWALRKVELNAKNKIYFTEFEFVNLLANHSKKMGIPSHTIQATLKTAYEAWQRCFKKKSGKPKLKGVRNKLCSIPFPDALRNGKKSCLTANKVTLPTLGAIRYHKQVIPDGNITSSRLIRRADGWHLCMFVATSRKPIARVAHNEVGVDPGFKDLITLSDGTKHARPTELAKKAVRLAQAQRGKRKRLTAKIHLKIANQRKDRNHKLSLKLVQENVFIAFSKDNHKAVAKRFGKSVSNAAHYQLQQMLVYKSRIGGTKYIEVGSKNSTKTCSCCGCLTGPTGLAGLSVRLWDCNACGEQHDRDINAARNTYIAGAGAALERIRKCA